MQNLNRNAYFERCSGKINGANPSQLHVDFDPHIRIPPIDHAAVRFQARSHLPALPTVSSSHRGLVARKGSGTAPVSAHAHCPVARQWSPNVDRRQRRCRGTRQASDDPGDEWGMAMTGCWLPAWQTWLIGCLMGYCLILWVEEILHQLVTIGNYMKHCN